MIRQRLGYLGQLAVLVASGWAVGVSLYLFLAPITVYEMTATAGSSGTGQTEEVIREQSWYQVQGLWGTMVLGVVAGFYLLGLYVAWRAAYRLLAVFSVIALAFSYVAGFSIGYLYLPSAVGLIIGTILIGWSSAELDSGPG